MSGNVTVLIPFLRTGNRDWLQECVDSFPDCKALVCENEGELAEALNTGLESVTTPYVFVTGADDRIQPGSLRLLESLIWNVDVVYPSLLLTDEEMREQIGLFPAQPFCGNRLLDWNFVPGAFLARTSALKDVGGWRHLEALEDWDLHVRLHRAGYRFKPVPEALVLYRQVAGSRNKPKDGFDKKEWQDRIVGQRPNVLATFYHQATPATTYWRCQVPSKHLPGLCQPDMAVEYTDDDIWVEGHEGTAVVQFPGDKFRAAASVLVFPANGIRTLLETDDNYLAPNPHRKRQRWEMRIGEGEHTVEGHRSVAAKVDGVIVATDYLASQYRKVNPNVYVCPNSVDPDDWPEIEKPDDGVFRIGWFASLSHQNDCRLVRRALEWASGQKDVEVVTMGFDPGWRFPRRHIPWSNDLATYWKLMGALDVGLAPVVASPWALGRSDLKALEYALSGACPVLSDEAPYSPWENERGCLKAKTAKDFYTAVRRLVGNRDEAKQLAADAKAYVLRERTIQNSITKWREAIEDG